MFETWTEVVVRFCTANPFVPEVNIQCDGLETGI
jgi:hypothetical protein